MATHRRIVKTAGADFYPTPAWATWALLSNETFWGNILEPCCGAGDMAEVLKNSGCPVFASDINDWGYGEVIDFFEIKATYPNIITNPPFNIAEQVLEKALKHGTKKVCLLLRLAFLESKRRYKKIFSVNPPTRLHVFTERLSMYPKGSVLKGGGTTAYAWFVWDMCPPITLTDNNITKINWIKPGFKEMYDGK